MAPLPIFFIKMDFASDNQGWSEVFISNANTVASAKTAAVDLITKRLAMLSANVELVYANLTQLKNPRKAFALTTGVQPGVLASPANDANDAADCILLRQETADGDHANRFLHAPPDDAIVSGEYFVTGVAAYDTALTAFRTALISDTGYLRKPDKLDPTTWSVISWASVNIRGKTRHKVGRPFDERRGKRRTA